MGFVQGGFYEILHDKFLVALQNVDAPRNRQECVMNADVAPMLAQRPMGWNYEIVPTEDGQWQVVATKDQRDWSWVSATQSDLRHAVALVNDTARMADCQARMCRLLNKA